MSLDRKAPLKRGGELKRKPMKTRQVKRSWEAAIEKVQVAGGIIAALRRISGGRDA